MTFEVEIKDAPNDGTVFMPVGLESPPGILVLHGSEGGASGWSHMRALWLAQHGFATFPFSYSKDGTPWRAGNIIDIDLDATEDALTHFHTSICKGSPTGLFGVSRGAEQALLLASLMSESEGWVPEAIAAHAASDVVAGPFVNTGDESKEGKKPWKWRGSYEHVQPDSPIPIEKYEGRLFLSHGVEDEIWSVDRTRRIEARLRNNDRDLEVHYYAGQGHMLDRQNTNTQNRRLLEFFTSALKENVTKETILNQSAHTTPASAPR